jgi:hypothetical protein
MDNSCLQMPGFGVQRRFVCAPSGVGAERQLLASIARAIVFLFKFVELHAKSIAF